MLHHLSRLQPFLEYSTMRLFSRNVFLGVFALSFCMGCAEDPLLNTPPPVMTADRAEERKANEKVDEDPPRVAGERQPYDGLAFAIPEGWEELPLSEMQRGIVTAKFTMPEDAPDATLTLSRSGGGIEANLDRWRGQVTQSRAEVSETITVAGIDATLIDLEGRFSGGFGKPPQDDARMLGAIVPLSDQGYFIKLTGPADQIAAVEDDFRVFLKSAARE